MFQAVEDFVIDLNRIPFGLSTKDNLLVDVADVPRGSKCGCLCPSCKTPLIARHGDVNEWHFAHASRSISGKIEKSCEFSFFVSVRLMARQIIGDKLDITLPACQGTLKKFDRNSARNVKERFTVTGSKTIRLSDVRVEAMFAETSVDIIGQVGDFQFVLYLVHPGRKTPQALFNPENTHCGIISVSLTNLPEKFRQIAKSKISYQSILLKFLSEDLDSKRWVFHPRYSRIKEKAQQRLDERVPDIKPEPKISPTKSVRMKDRGEQSARHHLLETSENKIDRKNKYNIKSKFDFLIRKSTEEKIVFVEKKKRLALFECVMCREQWQGQEPGFNECPECKTHLYSVFKKYLDK